MMDWFDSWFESPWYMRLYRHRTDAEARRAVHLVLDIAGIPRGSRILDLCCGYGRHALALAEDGFAVIGLDSSIYLIDRAREVYPHANVEYVVGDMRGPYPHAPFDAIVNFFTSFGYFDTHEENAHVIRTMAESVRPGGMVVMDFFNAERVRANLVPESMDMIDGVTILQERWIEEPFVRKRITVNNPCRAEQTFEERVWLYTAGELQAMMTGAGLDVRSIFGTYDGDPFHPMGSERCIIIAQRPQA
jgi:SAM-dependent methyltransferase